MVSSEIRVAVIVAFPSVFASISPVYLSTEMTEGLSDDHVTNPDPLLNSATIVSFSP